MTTDLPSRAIRKESARALRRNAERLFALGESDAAAADILRAQHIESTLASDPTPDLTSRQKRLAGRRFR